APNLLCNYLFTLAQAFNTFYNQHSILKAEQSSSKQLRLNLTQAVASVLKQGLELLGIEVVEKM
ncbi:MAG: arginine--tRNA ligase, partial [Candidatus Pacebacteria bacterium]|nr:arginine--tRNA ligase [Candidatus Paceibacterota bacterium]